MSSFNYKVLIYFKDNLINGSVDSFNFLTDCPCSIGHTLDFEWDKKTTEYIELKVFEVRHSKEGSTIYCDYDYHYDERYLKKCFKKLGIEKSTIEWCIKALKD